MKSYVKNSGNFQFRCFSVFLGILDYIGELEYGNQVRNKLLNKKNKPASQQVYS